MIGKIQQGISICLLVVYASQREFSVDIICERLIPDLNIIEQNFPSSISPKKINALLASHTQLCWILRRKPDAKEDTRNPEETTLHLTEQNEDAYKAIKSVERP